jgi:hypothetical protein
MKATSRAHQRYSGKFANDWILPTNQGRLALMMRYILYTLYNHAHYSTPSTSKYVHNTVILPFPFPLPRYPSTSQESAKESRHDVTTTSTGR